MPFRSIDQLLEIIWDNVRSIRQNFEKELAFAALMAVSCCVFIPARKIFIKVRKILDKTETVSQENIQPMGEPSSSGHLAIPSNRDNGSLNNPQVPQSSATSRNQISAARTVDRNTRATDREITELSLRRKSSSSLLSSDSSGMTNRRNNSMNSSPMNDSRKKDFKAIRSAKEAWRAANVFWRVVVDEWQEAVDAGRDDGAFQAAWKVAEDAFEVAENTWRSAEEYREVAEADWRFNLEEFAFEDQREWQEAEDGWRVAEDARRVSVDAWLENEEALPDVEKAQEIANEARDNAERAWQGVLGFRQTAEADWRRTMGFWRAEIAVWRAAEINLRVAVADWRDVVSEVANRRVSRARI